MQFNTSNYQPPQGSVPAGNYDFQVVSAEEATSQSGNEMIKLTLAVFVPGRQEPVTVYDYLVATEKALFKIEQFAVGVGHPEWFQVNGTQAQGSLTAQMCFQMRGKAKFICDKDTGYLRCAQYIKPEGYTEQPASMAPPAPAPAATPLPANVPFQGTPAPAPAADPHAAPAMGASPLPPT